MNFGLPWKNSVKIEMSLFYDMMFEYFACMVATTLVTSQMSLGVMGTDSKVG